MSDEDDLRTYEIMFADGSKQRLTVPATFKVTFGAVVPASAKSAGQSYATQGWGLRFWSAQDKQHAVFSGVASFRDISLPIQVAAVRKFGAPDDEWYPDDGSDKPGTVERQWKLMEEVKERVPETNEDDDEKPDAWSRARARGLVGVKAR